MARKREIKPSFYADEDLAECSIWARHLFPALWQLADRDGRLDDRPAFIRIHAFPYDNLEALGLSVNDMLEELARPRRHCPEGAAFIVRYVVDGRAYIQIRNFKKHQRVHPNEVTTQIPPVPKVTKDGTPNVTARSTKGDSARDISHTAVSLQSLSSLPSSSLVTTDPVATAPAPPAPMVETPPAVAAPSSDDTATTPGEVSPLESVALAKARVLSPEPSPSWSREAAELWTQEYRGSPPKAFFAALKPLVKREGWERVRPALVTYLAETPVEYVNLVKAFVGAFGIWEAKSRGAPARASPGRGSVGERTLAAAERFIKRGGEVDRPERVLVGPEQIGDGRASGDR